MKKSLKTIGALILVPSVGLSATYTYNGYINYNVRSIKGEETAADATKYDPKKPIFGNFGAMAVADTNEFTLFGNDVGNENQGYSLFWRKFNTSKVNFQFSELTHNLSRGASTGYSGLGGRDLTYSGAAFPALAAWSPFDYKVKRDNYGVSATTNVGDHFYLSFGSNRIEYDGIKPMGFLSVSGSFGTRKISELPETVKFANTAADAEFGYRGENSSIALKGYFSHSLPEFDHMTIRDQLLSTPTFINYTTSPASKFYRIGIDGSFFKLPLNSTVSFDLSTTKTWNELYLDNVAPGFNSTATTSPANASTLLFNAPTFKGDIKGYNAKVMARSKITDNFSSQLYLRYYDRKNASTDVTTSVASGGPYETDTRTNETTGFIRNNAGLVLSHNLPLSTKAELTLDYLKTKRNDRSDVDKTNDYTGKLFVENYHFDKVTPRVQYTYLQTESNFLNPTRRGVNYKFLRRFDVNDKVMQQMDVGADVTLLESIKYGRASLSGLFGYKHNAYKYVVLGRRNDNRHIIDGSLNYNLPDVVKVNLFAYVEQLNENSVNNNVAAGTLTSAALAAMRNTALEDKVFTYGADVTVPIIEDKLDTKVSYSHYKSDGRVDYKFPNASTAASSINANDDYTADTIKFMMNYYWKKYLSFAVGYNYENFDYSDIRVNGYRQVINNNFYTGAYRDRPFKINEAWAGATYKF